MTHIIRVAFLLSLSIQLSGCTPALYTRLFNATGEVITVTNSESKDAITIAAGTAADVPLPEPRQQLFVRTGKHFWSYSLRDFYRPHWQLSLWEQHTGVMRTYGRVDSRGRIYVLAPPDRGQSAREIPQPPGFPISPRKKT